MTIRNRLTLRFSLLVSSILLLVFVSIYAFCWYFITTDFYRRLDRKAATLGDMMLHHRLDADLIRRMSQLRRDQLPDQCTMVYDGRDSLLMVIHQAPPPRITAAQLALIRTSHRTDFQQDDYAVSGRSYQTPTGLFVVVASARDHYGNGFLGRLAGALAGLFGLAVGITVLAGRIFAADALRPVQQIDQTLGRIFPQHQHERLPIRTQPDEISRLSATINRLLDRVSESFRLQRLFVSNVSHELQNPLTRISSQLEVSLLNERTPHTYQDTIGSVLDDVRSLSALTQELLRLSQVSQPNTNNLITSQVRVDELVWDVRDEVLRQNTNYHVRVDTDTLPDNPDTLAVAGNQTLLFTALKNLVENACKFAPDGQATVAVESLPTEVRIRIENHGDPIPLTDQPYLFEPFYRSRQTADQVRGYGVGLSLVERIVRLHGGQVQVRSAAGQPTVFTVSLPRPLAGG
jgi:two-component system, OmpR family, heavy metal sensor histidine kinase CusS